MVEEIGIIKAVLDGDIDSFRLLVERYQKPIITSIRNIIHDDHMCEDTAQDVFLTAYKKLASFDPARGSFSTWLFTIARNKSLNMLKKKIPATVSNPPENSDSPGPAGELLRDELFDELDRALKTLNPRQKRAFVLAEFENLPYEQIAQIEGARIGTIKSRINRAKKKLRSALKDLSGDI